MSKEAQNLSVQIVRFVDESFPGWVACQFTDASGRVHTIVEKYPIVAAEMLDADSQYPQPGAVECEVLERSEDARGRKIVRVGMPGIESTEGLSEFVVLADGLDDEDLSGPTDKL